MFREELQKQLKAAEAVFEVTVKSLLDAGTPPKLVVAALQTVSANLNIEIVRNEVLEEIEGRRRCSE